MLTAFFSWWYTSGWGRQVERSYERLQDVADMFSIGLLIRTWGAPFRQISAGQINGPIAEQLRIIVDKLVSRMIGAMIRSVMIVIGCGAIILSAIVGMMMVVIWPFMPLLPLAGILLALVGWMPWH